MCNDLLNQLKNNRLKFILKPCCIIIIFILIFGFSLNAQSIDQIVQADKEKNSLKGYINFGTGWGNGELSTYSASIFVHVAQRKHIVGLTSARFVEPIQINNNNITRIPQQISQEITFVSGFNWGKSKYMMHLALGPAYIRGVQRAELLNTVSLLNGQVEEYRKNTYNTVGAHFEIVASYLASKHVGIGMSIFGNFNPKRHLWGVHVIATFKK